MANARLSVQVDEKGARKVRVDLESVGRAGREAGRGVSLLSTALRGLGVAAAVNEFIRMSSTLTALENRTRLVTSGQSNLRAVFQGLRDVANETRSSFEGTANLYNRLAINSRELGASQQELVNFTRALNQTITLSGATAHEAENALIQFSQGMASGALRGDELRSVLEQLPAVADVIAEHLGVTRGELRDLGKEGKITGTAILEAFREAAPQIAKDFETTVPSIKQTFVVLRNELLFVVDSFNRTTGAANGFSKIVLTLADNLPTLIRLLGAAGLLGILLKLPALLTSATTGVATLTAAIAANPFGALAVAIAATISLLVAFSDQIGLGGDSVANLADVFVSTFAFIGRVIKSALDRATKLFESFVGNWTRGAKEIKFGFGDVARGIALTLDTIFGFAIGVQNVFSRVFGDIFKLFRNIAAGGNIKEAFELFGQGIRNSFLEGFNQSAITDAVNEVLGDAESRARKRLSEKPGAISDESGEALIRATEEEAGRGRSRERLDFDEIIRGLEREIELLQLGNKEREAQVALDKIIEDFREHGQLLELTPDRIEQLDSLIRLKQIEQEEADILQELNGEIEDNSIKRDALNRLYADGTITAQQFTQAMEDLLVAEQNLSTQQQAVLDEITQIEERFQDTGSVALEVSTGGVQALNDGFRELAAGGNFGDAFRESFANILLDISQVIVKMLLLKQIADALGFGGPSASLLGGGNTGAIPTFPGVPIGPARAEGGPVFPGKAYPVGEEGPELFVPGQTGAIIPNVNVTTPAAPPAQVVIVSNQEEAIAAALASPGGEQILISQVRKNPRAFRAALGV